MLLVLPEIGYQGSTITWSSEPEGAVLADGTLSRPQPGAEALAVKLTATVEKDGAAQSKAFQLSLEPMTQEEVLIDTALKAFEAVPDADDITEAMNCKQKRK